jgi:hypothetical protein
MSDASTVLEGAAVYDSLGGCLGFVDRLDGDDLLVGHIGDQLRIPLEWVDEVGDSVRLCKTCNQARAAALATRRWGRSRAAPVRASTGRGAAFARPAIMKSPGRECQP